MRLWTLWIAPWLLVSTARAQPLVISAEIDPATRGVASAPGSVLRTPEGLAIWTSIDEALVGDVSPSTGPKAS